MAKRLVAPFMSAGLALGLALGGPAGAAEAGLRVGAGKAEIVVPSTLLPIQGFGVARDPLQARVLVLDNGAKRVALAVVDMTSIFDGAVEDFKQIIARADGVDPADIFVCASHTFSAPHIMPVGRSPSNVTMSAEEQAKNEQFRAAVADAVQKAATTAAQGLTPARMGFGLGASSVNVNRNQLTAGGWWLGADDSGFSDKSVAVVRFEDLARHPLAVLMNYAVQSSIMDQAVVKDGAKAITADLGGAAARHVESHYGDPTVSMFLIGAAGDQAPAYKAYRYVLDKNGKSQPVDIGAQGYLLVDLLGERLGAEVVRVSDGAGQSAEPPVLRVLSGSVALDSQDRPKNLQDLHPTKTYDYKITGKTQAPYVLMRIGDVALVGVQAELSSATGADIKAHSPFKKTIVMTMVNGAAKYMPGADDYKRITYEAMNSPYGPGSAEIFSSRILQDLNALHRDPEK